MIWIETAVVDRLAALRGPGESYSDVVVSRRPGFPGTATGFRLYDRDNDMDFWEFLARSEWPVVVAGGLYLFREPIKRALERAEKVSSPFVTLELARQAKGELEIQAQAVKEVEIQAQTIKAEATMTGNAELVAKAEKIEAAVEKVATANNAVSSTLSGILRVTDAQDIANFRGTVGGPS